jgi:ABC-type phosphate transport system auxiliary subunit
MNLTRDQLTLKGIHPEFGEVALSELIAAWVAHDMTHIRQIAQFLAKKYTNEVGPWKEFLSILQ